MKNENENKNYNAQLNQAGDSSYVMKKTITKDNNIKKAFIYVPADKAVALLSMLNNKGGNNTIDEKAIADSMVLIRNNNIVAIVKGDSIRFGNYKTAGYTARGIRLNEKHIEGLIDYNKTYNKVEKSNVIIDDSLSSIADCFKTTTATLTIDDLLSL